MRTTAGTPPSRLEPAHRAASRHGAKPGPSVAGNEPSSSATGSASCPDSRVQPPASRAGRRGSASRRHRAALSASVGSGLASAKNTRGHQVICGQDPALPERGRTETVATAPNDGPEGGNHLAHRRSGSSNHIRYGDRSPKLNQAVARRCSAGTAANSAALNQLHQL